MSQYEVQTTYRSNKKPGSQSWDPDTPLCNTLKSLKLPQLMSLITLRFLKWSCMVCFRIFQHLPFISALLPGLLLIWSFTLFKTIPSHPQSCPVFMANKGLEGNNLVSSPLAVFNSLLRLWVSLSRPAIIAHPKLLC